MKSIPWIAAGVGFGLAAYVLLTRYELQPAPRYATGHDTGLDQLDDAGGKAGAWGAKQRVSGLGNRVTGKLKEGFGRATGDQDLAGEGVLDQATGAVKDGVGQLAQAAGQTVRDLNF